MSPRLCVLLLVLAVSIQEIHGCSADTASDLDKCREGDLQACKNVWDKFMVDCKSELGTNPEDMSEKCKEHTKQMEEMELEKICADGNQKVCTTNEAMKLYQQQVMTQALGGQGAVDKCLAGNSISCTMVVGEVKAACGSDPEGEACTDMKKKGEEMLAKITEKCENGDQEACNLKVTVGMLLALAMSGGMGGGT